MPAPEEWASDYYVRCPACRHVFAADWQMSESSGYQESCSKCETNFLVTVEHSVIFTSPAMLENKPCPN